MIVQLWWWFNDYCGCGSVITGKILVRMSTNELWTVDVIIIPLLIQI